MRYYGPCSNNYIIANSGITQDNTVRSYKYVVSNFHNSNFSKRTSFSRAGIMCKEPHII